MNSEMLRAGGLIIYRKLQMGIEYLLLQTSYGQHHWTPPKGNTFGELFSVGGTCMPNAVPSIHIGVQGVTEKSFNY